jgi:tetratricopeptide (TPR) repeat protein
MKQITTSLLILLSIAACNNAVNEQPVTQQPILPVQEKEMKDAIAKYPDSAKLRNKLIAYFEANGNIDLAIAETNKAIERDTTNADFLDTEARLYLLNDDTTNGIKAYEKAIEIYPDPQYIMSLGWLYAQKKDSNALVMADALIIGKNARAEKEALLIKGLYFNATGNKQKAIVFFNSCLALDYTYTLAYREKAIALYDLEKYEEAITTLKKAVTLQNKFDEGYYWLGRCYEKMKDNNAAIDNYRTALLYNPDYVEAKDALGKLGAKQ